jgi:hypothetical protein
MKTVLYISLFAFASLYPDNAIIAARFSLEGTLVNAYYDQGRLAGSGTNRFYVSVDDCQCRIRVDRKTGGILFDEYSSPASNSFSLTVYSDNISDYSNGIGKVYDHNSGTIELSQELNTKPTNQATLTINIDAIPDFKKDFITPVWLAYASACLFEKPNGNKYMPPIYPLGESPGARVLFSASRKEVQTRWTKEKEFPFYLNELDVLRSGKWLIDNGNMVELEVPAALKPHDAIYSYRTVSWTNAFGLRIPNNFTVRRR